MVAFYVNLVKFYMGHGLTKEQALAKVPVKWREAVRAALGDDTTDGERGINNVS